VMLPYGGATAPTGWLLCDGSAVSRTTYAGLYAAIGTSYGTGDGSTTFNLPDLRGRVALGAGTGAGGGASGSGKPAGGSALTARTVGDWAGEEKHLLSVAEMPSHAHGTKAGDGFAAAGSAFHAALAYQAGCNNDTCPTVGAGGDTPHNVLQPFTVANYIIKQ
jgi:microcystin-dependent protein